jgi:hypothetical protein
MPWLHLVAIPCGLLLGEAVMCYHFVVHNACRIIHEDYARLMLRTWSTLVLTCIASLLTGWLVNNVGIGFTGLRWVLSVASTTMITGLCVWPLLLQRSDRELVLDRVLKAVGLRKTPVSVTFEAAK